jgi:hypothetical protein
MTQATKYYLPFFKTGYPFAKLYTYISGDRGNTLTPTYNAAGVANPNPVIADAKGNYNLYLNSDIVYRFQLYDQNNNLIYDMENIRQLNGDPGDPGGTGPQGPVGKKGSQGLSGSQGATGDKGPDGDKGYPYLTRLETASTQTYYIQKGIKEIYITATGGGGSAASWSPFIFIFKQSNPAGGYFDVQCLYKETNTGSAGYANNQVSYEKYNFGAFVFMPGSGFSGNSVYRKKITLDPTIENKIDVFCGAGGQTLSTKLNGVDGQATTIYVNDTKVLTLNGGKGGLNKFPYDSNNVPTLPIDGSGIQLNRGFHNGLLYMFNQTPYIPQYTTPSEGQKTYIWNTTYRKNNYPSGYIIQNIQTSYYAPLLSIGANQFGTYVFPNANVDNLNGESNLFNSIYSYYQNKYDLTTSSTSTFYKTSIKIGKDSQGYGAGGDVYYGFNGQQNMVQNYFFNGYIASQSGYTLTFFDQTYIKSRIIDQLKKFTTSNSYAAGTGSQPSMDDSATWIGLTNIQNTISNTSQYINFTKSGFYDSTNFRKNMMANNANAIGGKGVDGYCIIEYGSITEHTPVV